MSMLLNIHVNPEEYRRFTTLTSYGAYDGKLRQAAYPDFNPVLFIVISLVLVGLSIVFNDKVQIALPLLGIGIAIGGAIYFGLEVWKNKRFFSKLLAENEDLAVQATEHRFSEEGVTLKNESGEFTYNAQSFQRAFEDDALILVYLSPVRALIYPKRELSKEQQAFIKGWVKGFDIEIKDFEDQVRRR